MIREVITPLKNLYDGLVIRRPALALFLIAAVIAFLTYHAQHFRLDASSDTLVLQKDKSLEYYREIRNRYGSDDFLIVTYTPQGELFDKSTLKDLQSLKADLSGLERVTSIISILNVPLIKTGEINLNNLDQGIPQLRDEDVPLDKARQELVTSPLYKNVLISSDGKTTALLASLEDDEKLTALRKKRDRLRDKADREGLSAGEKQQLENVRSTYRKRLAAFQQAQEQTIEKVRQTLAPYEDSAEIFIGGIPMIVADSINFIRKDLRTFGLGVLALIVVLLSLIFRRPRWVALPIITCAAVGVSAIGFLGLVHWPATIVSANFVALLLIFTLSFCVHQIVRYREYALEHPDADQADIVRDMVGAIALPCFYMAITTGVAFASLIVSDIKPVIDFGRMMSVGMALAYVIAFTLFPAALMLVRPLRDDTGRDITYRITNGLYAVIRDRGAAVTSAFVLIVILCVWGMNYLYVQNRFIDYYKKDTEIYQGMKTVDQKLGGTTPMDVIIDAPQNFLKFQAEEKKAMEEMGMGGYGSGGNAPDIVQGYFFSDVVMEDVAGIHDYLQSRPEIGKVLSLHTTVQVFSDIAGENKLDRFALGVIYQKIPQKGRDILFAPYVADDGNQIRFSVRVYETQGQLNRQELIDTIRKHLTQDMGLNADQVHLTGMVVLYNNVLQTLFSSQIQTIGVVFAVLFVLFRILFRSWRMACLALVPNIAAVCLVLGVMGWFSIPMDIMTITIAAICFGIANDDTIHYVHRFMNEYRQNGQYQDAIRQSHNTIGRAVFYTSVTIVLGFSVLMLSNFVPTIYFGLLTGLSMFVALAANLTVLPILIAWVKPFGSTGNA